MILAAMQPYCFPYLGYYQLAAGVDHFVFLDDAAFIRRGHIHRNTLLQNGRPWHYTLPVAAASQNRPINRHHFAGGFARFLLQLRHAYARAPFRDDVIALVAATCRPEDGNVAEVCEASVRNVFDYLGLHFTASRASSLDVEGRGAERILALCRHFGAGTYHNAPGGRALYSTTQFAARGIELRFVQPAFPAYRQPGMETFMPGLSMIDVLMNNPPPVVRGMLAAARLEAA